ncbi:hypothetical protein F444_05007 [Phytophthora nicotianae P1976]|uniref:Ubiquitin-like protease family profile domain-containing protein n=1 Tax=Phytophthora nicotianae P1976 TaxID=1317066 RepID=A0A081ANP4_PHYNI|nr:hypothetical protein F444_05007 [Phytophthora nicotianae P1976]
MHNFAIPVDLTRSMQAAITTAKREQCKPDELDESVKKHGIVLDMVASIDPQIWKFSGAYIGSLVGFHAIKTKGHVWFEDRKWLEQNWLKIPSNVSLFARETRTQGLSADAVCNRHKALANENDHFREHFGRAVSGWLNDSHIDFCLRTLGSVVGNCYAISSLLWIVGWPSIPKAAVARTKFILHAVNLDSSHWGIIMVHLQATSDTVLRAHVYIASMPDDVELVVDKPVWIETPQQPDTASCGVLIVAQAHSCLTGHEDQRKYGVSKDDVKVMRLRMLWVIMHHSKERAMSEGDAAKTSNILQRLQDELK